VARKRARVAAFHRPATCMPPLWAKGVRPHDGWFGFGWSHWAELCPPRWGAVFGLKAAAGLAFAPIENSVVPSFSSSGRDG